MVASRGNNMADCVFNQDFRNVTRQRSQNTKISAECHFEVGLESFDASFSFDRSGDPDHEWQLHLFRKWRWNEKYAGRDALAQLSAFTFFEVSIYGTNLHC